MITPKEKADELIEKFIQYTPADEDIEYEYAKECALIAVDGIINSNPIFVTSELEGKDGMHEAYLYWKKVRQEIEKL